MKALIEVVQQLRMDPLLKEEKEAWDAIPEAVHMAARRQGLQGGLEVVVVGMEDAEIQVLNRDFRLVDRPTDVLSFPQWNPEEIAGLMEGMPLGDIVISIPRARQQAEDYGHSFRRELSFLAVHGFLHLLGFDHQTPEETQVMEEEQRSVLEAIGLPR